MISTFSQKHLKLTFSFLKAYSVVCQNTTQFTFRTFQVAQTQNLRKLLSNWIDREPLASCLKVTKQEWDKQYDIVLPEYSANGLCVVAVDNYTNQIVGTLTTIAKLENIRKHLNATFSDLSRPYAQIIAFIGQLHRQSEVNLRTIFPGCEPNKTAYPWLLHTDHRYKKMGIAQKCVQYGEMACKQAGFEYLKAQATGQYSARIFFKNGWKMVGSKNTREYVLNGKNIFRDVDPNHQTLRLFVKKLT